MTVIVTSKWITSLFVFLFFYRQDWGAIVLIDERFNKSPRYTNGKELLLYVSPDVEEFVRE